MSKREELVRSQTEVLREDSSRKWRWMKGVEGVGVVIILSASLLLLGSVENVLEVSRWMHTLFSSSSYPCLLLYLFLNILIITLALNSTSTSASSCQCSQPCHIKPEVIIYESHSSPSFERVGRLKGERKDCEERVSDENGEEVEGGGEREKTPGMVLQRSSSVRGLLCKKVKKASNLSRESRPTQPPVEVVFEICSMEEECSCDEEKEKEKEGISNMSCEELNAKAESFIGNFYRELKMQREESWKRLCAVYRKSC